MNRKTFVTALGTLPFIMKTMKLNQLEKIISPFGNTDTMPLLFVGHGNPMNAITENEFANTWMALGKIIPKPNAILCISAHWETNGTFVTSMEKPKTIHDFGGFPQELFDVQYPAPGSTELAFETKNSITKTIVGLDKDWGLDHGCWSVVKRMYPDADIPIIEMSLDYNKPPQWHYDLAKELASLRRKGILILGSGNWVHNLGIMDFNRETGFDWAIEANETIKKLIIDEDYQPLINYKSLGRALQLAVPTNEHYLPLLYILGLKEANDHLSFFNDKTIGGSISMTGIKLFN